jgi:hypothetical protein
MSYSPGTLLQVVGIAGGAAAFVLSVLAWEFFRGSPFGNLVAFLPVLVAAFTGLGVLSVAVPAASLVFELAEAVVYTWLLVFVALMVRLHARLSPTPRRDTDG